MARHLAGSRSFGMSDTPERAADVELACPKCGNKPFVMAGTEPREIHSIADFSGLSCAGCGHVVSESDVESAMKSAIDKLMKDTFGGRGGKF
jgi:DNA-directed RNA polymerase subunit RPC12/RpoP